MEIALVVLIFVIISLVFPWCFYKALSTDDPQSNRWLVATVGCVFLCLILGTAGVVIYG